MTMARCPQCQAEVHPLLGPVPLVVGARVVMCCSTGCAAALRKGSGATHARAAEAGALGEASPGAAAKGAPAGGAAKGAPAGAAAKGAPAGAAAKGALPNAARETTAEALARGEDGRQGWRARVHGWPLSAALLAIGVMLLVLAAYLIMEYASASPGVAKGRGLARPGKGGRALVPRAPPDRPTDAVTRQGIGPPSVREVGLLALRQRSFETLAGFLGSEAVRFRILAAQVLAEQGEAIAAEILRRELGAELWTTKHLAAEALARLGDPKGLARLKEDLASPRLPVRRSAAYALARAGDPAGLPLLRGLALHAGHRLTAYEALAGLGDEGAKRYLQAFVVTNLPVYDRLRAAVALGLAGDRTGLALLKARLREPDMHLGVALALQQLGSPDAPLALRRALVHSALRVEAARALWVHGDLSGLDEVGPALESASAEARLTGAASILILTAQARAEVR